ncbi:MAG: AAA family ATPase [Proteobacteria bacterium]|nr:AAA family ATPase [Pseudomonadota bacterium]
MADPTEHWLRQLGLEEYAGIFAEQRIDQEVLPHLTDGDLEKLGIPLGPRKKLLRAIEGLEADSAPSSGRPDTQSQAADSSQAERRQLTVMFCDLVGSTELSQRLDPEDLREINRAYQDLCKNTLESYEGTIARYMGDGVLAYFGYPQAHEDDAERAVLASLDLLQAMAGLNAEISKDHEVDLSIRIGIATGPVVVGDLIGEGASRENAVVGETPNVAARLQALAEPGSVIIAPGTYALTGRQFEYQDAGTHGIKGIAEPVRTWRVIGRSAARSRFEALHRSMLTPLIGREHEIALLLDRWQQAKDGDGQVVVLTGEAGIGKSRIAETLRDRTAAEQPMRLRYQCSPHHSNSELFPFVEAFQRAAQFKDSDAAADKLEKLESLLSQGTDDVAAVAPLFAALLSVPTGTRYPPLDMSAEALKARTLEALYEQVEGLSRRRPVLVLFEDAHWADPTSLELLAMLIEQVRSAQVLILITARPEFSPSWSDYMHITSFNLNRFSRGLVNTMVEKVTRGKSLPDEVREQIIDRTDGVPLFVEELTKTVLESGLLEERGASYVLTGPLPPLAIPSTLNDSLMARLDRLGPIKDVAQTAAVIGREFSYALLAAVSPLADDALQDALGQLVEAELIFPHGRTRHSYIFKHALVQEAAYDSMLRKRRRQLHGSIADAIQDRFPEIVTGQPEMLARHFSAAGQAATATDYWLQAGRRATERSANKEAVRHLLCGLEELKELAPSVERDRLELSLQIAMTTPITAISGFGSPESDASYDRAHEPCEVLGATEQLVTVFHGQWVRHTAALSHREAGKVAAQLLRMGEREDIEAARMIGHRLSGWNAVFRGNLDEAGAHLEQALSIYDQDRVKFSELRLRSHHDHRVATLSCIAIHQWLCGFPDQALATRDETISYARGLEHATSLAYALFHAGCWLATFSDDPGAARDFGDELLELANHRGLPMYMAAGTVIKGWVDGRSGDLHAGIAQFQDGLVIIDGGGNRYFLPGYLALLTQLHIDSGNADDALRTLDEAKRLVDQSGERMWESELHRLTGDVLSMSGEKPSELVQPEYERAREVARRTGAKSLEFRASTSLARLWSTQGRYDEAREVLKPIYACFTEGLDTADLRLARSVLAELP